MPKDRFKLLFQKWSLVGKVLPFVLGISGLKTLAHFSNLELMELNTLFTSLVAGTIFLIGFLISGVLSDFKESEKLPSELAASFRSLWDDTYTIWKAKDSAGAEEFFNFQKMLLSALGLWFYKKERTLALLEKISGLNEFFILLEKEGVQPNYIIKMKSEQNSIRRMILRIDTIRDTSFVGSAYAIVEAMGFLTAIGLILIKITPFYASLFLTILVTFLIYYMILLIKDLDNPFDYANHGEAGTEVSLKPLHDLENQWGIVNSSTGKGAGVNLESRG
jgi:hypothetical protein